MPQGCHQSLQLHNSLISLYFYFPEVSGHSPMCIEQKVIVPSVSGLSDNAWFLQYLLKLTRLNWIALLCTSVQKDGLSNSWSSLHTLFREWGSTLFFFSCSMIALGELIVILNRVFLPAFPQGKEKSRTKHGITIKPDTCKEHDLLWALRCCDFPSQREITKWKGKYGRCGTCLVKTQQ